MIKTITLDNGKVLAPPSNYKKVLLYKRIFSIAFILLILLSILTTDFSFLTLFKNGHKFFDILYEMLPPLFDKEALMKYFSYSYDVFPELIKTFQMAMIGTIFGAILAYPIAVLASSNISNKYLTIFVKIILSLTRTLPVLVYAMILTYVFGLGEFAGAVSITIFTFGIVSKMLYENIEKTDMGAYEAATSSGLSRYNAFNVAVMPQILPSFYSLGLYALEINIRSATILGFVGAGGIGQQLNDAMSFRNYSEAGFIILFTIIIIIIIDLVTQAIRRRMI